MLIGSEWSLYRYAKRRNSTKASAEAPSSTPSAPSTIPVVAAPLLACEPVAAAELARLESDAPDEPVRVSTGAGCSGSVLLPGAGSSIQDTVEPSEYRCTALKVSWEIPSGSLP